MERIFLMRIYKPLNNNTKTKLSKMVASKRPVIFIKLETTGLDVKTDDIIMIRVLKTSWADGNLVIDDEFRRFIKSNNLTEEVSKINGITNEILNKNGVNLKTALLDLNDFLGPYSKEINLVSANISHFVGPFISAAEEETGIKLDIKNTLDILTMSKSLVCVSKYSKAYGHAALAKKLNVDNKDVLKSFVSMFNIMYKDIPLGTKSDFKNFVTSVKFWKSKGDSYIYIMTKLGELRLNATTKFFEETDKLFDEINLDEFLEDKERNPEENDEYSTCDLSQKELNERYEKSSQTNIFMEQFYGNQIKELQNDPNKKFSNNDFIKLLKNSYMQYIEGIISQYKKNFEKIKYFIDKMIDRKSVV